VSRIFVEVIHLGLTDDGQLGWSSATQILRGDDNPDTTARSLTTGAGTLQLIHSTSWRWMPPDTVILTYAAVATPPVGIEWSTSKLTDPIIVSSGDALTPRPDALHEHHIVAHAVVHLSLIARRDPTVAAVAQLPANRDLFATLHAIADATPTTTHGVAHHFLHGVPAAT